MQNMDMASKATEVAKFVRADAATKEAILLGYSALANGVSRNTLLMMSEQSKRNFIMLVSDNVIDWALSEHGSRAYTSAAQTNPTVGKLLSSKAEIMKVVQKARADLGVSGSNFTTLDELQGSSIVTGEKETGNLPVVDTSALDNIDMSELEGDEDAYTGNTQDLSGAFGFDDSTIDGELGLNNISEDSLYGEDEPSEDTSPKEGIKFDQDTITAESIDATKKGAIHTVGTPLVGEIESEIDIEGLEVPDDVDEMVSSILTRIEAVFKSCLELDRPYGMLYDKGMLSYKIGPGGVLEFTPGAGQGESIFERLFQAIVHSAGVDIKCPHDLRMVPNCANIEAFANQGNKTNYYFAGFTFKYALGVVDGKPYKSWGTFRPAAKESIKTRLMKLLKKGLFYSNQDLIENAFSNSILVLSYDRGIGVKLRISLPGVKINHVALENGIRSIRTYNNSGITISNVAGCNDVIDVQILLDEDKYLGRPSWAYKMMQVKINNNEPISLSKGLPMGRKANGEVVDFKLDPSSRFLTFIAAGSGAGKGVLTLSLVAGALGSNVPVFYVDFKPDMAPVFWEAEKRFGINTFSYDAMVRSHKNEGNPNYTLGCNMPPEAARAGLGGYAGAILYLKAVQLMCAMAKYRADHSGNGQKNIMFVFDETQAMQKTIKGLVELASRLKKDHKPKTVKGETEPGDSIYVYCDTLLKWAVNVDININTYINTTGRKSSTFCIFLAQNPDYTTWNNMIAECEGKPLKLLSNITMADTVCKILGKGSTTSKYGLGGEGKKNISAKEFKYIANNRFFGIYDGKTTDGADITVFKPFLTLNTDDIKDPCWVDGIGGMYGYGAVPEDAYMQNVKDAHPGDGQFTNSYGVHTGTGLTGLTSMYCMGEEARVAKSMQGGWDYCLEFFGATGLNQKYPTPTDYIYDFSLNGLMMIDNMIRYSPAAENSVLLGLGSGETDGEQEASGAGQEPDWVVGDTDAKQLGGSTPINMLEEDEGDLLDDFGVTGTVPSEHTAPAVPIGREQPLTAEQQVYTRNKKLGEAEQSIKFSNSFVPNQDVSPSDVPTGEIPLDDGEAFGDSFDDIPTQGYINPSPEIAASTSTTATSGGPTGKYNNVSPSEYNVGTILNKDNSIDCRIGPRHFLETKEPLFYKTMWGTRYEFGRRWDTVLGAIGDNINKNLVTRIALVGQQMYVNNKIVNMQNILGGYEDIRLENIIDFKRMFKAFPNTEEITIDFDILQRFQLEQPNLPTGFFAYSPRLMYVKMITDNKAIVVDRTSAITSPEAQKMYAKADMASKFTLASAVRSPRGMSDRAAGRNSKIWDTTKSYSSRGFQAAARQLKKDNPGLLRAAMYGGMGLIAATVGSLSLGVSKLFGLFGR